MNENNQLVRALGLKESISMTIGTVVGVGLFTCGSAQIGSVGSWICLLYTSPSPRDAHESRMPSSA